MANEPQPQGDPLAPTYEEFTNLAHQLYPEQSARIIAELRAAKATQRIAQLEAEAADVPQAVKKAAAAKRTATKKATSKRS